MDYFLNYDELDRLDYLEREVRHRRRARRFARIVIAFLLLGVLLLSMRVVAINHSPEILEAQRIMLRDRNGKIRAELMTEADGSPWLAFLSEDRVARCLVGLDRNGSPSVSLFDRSHETQFIAHFESNHIFGIEIFKGKKQLLSLNVNSDGRPMTEFRDREGQIRLALDLDRNGEPLLQLFGENDSNRLAIGAMNGNQKLCGLALHDENGKKRYMMLVTGDGWCGQILHDQGGNPRIRMGFYPEGVPRLSLTPDGSKDAVIFEVLPNGLPNLEFRNNDGSLKYRVPKQEGNAKQIKPIGFTGLSPY